MAEKSTSIAVEDICTLYKTSSATQRRIGLHRSTSTLSEVEGIQVKNGANRLGDRLEKCLALSKSSNPRRFLILSIIMIASLVILSANDLGQWIAAESAAWTAVNTHVSLSTTGVSTNSGPHFPGITLVAQMDPKHLPHPSKPKHSRLKDRRRLIFIGDIHGCRKELEALLKKVHFDPDRDHLVAAGDMVDKGPDTAGVVDLLKENEASCVRGNHEDNLLAAMDRGAVSSEQPDNSDEEPISRGGEPLHELARSLNKHQLEYLRSCPVILRVGHFAPVHGEIVVVHAGLVPGLSLDKQDPSAVMRMRIVDLKNHEPSNVHQRKGSIPWFKLWNKYQHLLLIHQKLTGFWTDRKLKKPNIHTTVIYGHDSKKGLRISKYTKGLDTGCVKGGQLTALIIGDGGSQEIVQVDCKGYW